MWFFTVVSPVLCKSSMASGLVRISIRGFFVRSMLYRLLAHSSGSIKGSVVWVKALWTQCCGGWAAAEGLRAREPDTLETVCPQTNLWGKRRASLSRGLIWGHGETSKEGGLEVVAVAWSAQAIEVWTWTSARGWELGEWQYYEKYKTHGFWSQVHCTALSLFRTSLILSSFLLNGDTKTIVKIKWSNVSIMCLQSLIRVPGS